MSSNIYKLANNRKTIQNLSRTLMCVNIIIRCTYECISYFFHFVQITLAVLLAHTVVISLIYVSLLERSAMVSCTVPMQMMNSFVVYVVSLLKAYQIECYL